MTNWERRQGRQIAENGQISLFPAGYWLNVQNGQEKWTDEPRPYTGADLVCKKFAVASMEWLKRQQGWTALKWRILPVDDDQQWVSNQQVKHSGRYSACVFDVWD